MSTMTLLVNLASQNIQCAIDWLRDATIGQEDHDSCTQPFFMGSHDKTFDPSQIVEDSAYTQRVHRLADRVQLPSLLRYVYVLLGSPTREFTHKGWTWLSLDKVEKHLEALGTEGQNKVCDVAIQYIGMGHIYVLSIDTETGNAFRRNDGGGNGYERTDHWNFIKAFDPSTKPECQGDFEGYVNLSVTNPDAPGQKPVNQW